MLSHTSCLSGVIWPTLAFSYVSKSPPNPDLVGLGPKYLGLVSQIRQQDAAVSNKQIEPVLIQKNRLMNTKEDKSGKDWLKVSREQSEDGIWPPSRSCKGKLAIFFMH